MLQPGASVVQLSFFFFGSCHVVLQPGASVVQLSFFFLAAAMLMAHWALMAQWPDTVPLGIYGPVARWRLEKNAWPFFFFGSLANVLPSVPKQKKKKKKKKKLQKKSPAI